MSVLAPVTHVWWVHTKRYSKRLIVAVVLYGAGVTIHNVILPLYYKQLFDTLGVAASAASTVLPVLTRIILFLVGFRVIAWVCFRIGNLAYIAMEAKVMADLERSAFSYLLGHSYQFFADHFAGSLVRKVNRLAKAYEEVSDNMYYKVVPLLLTFGGILFVLIRNYPIVGIVVLVWSVLFAISNIFYARWKLKYDLSRAELDSKATGVLSDAIGNHLTIKSFSASKSEERRYWEATQELLVMRIFGWNLNEMGTAFHWVFLIGIEAVVLYLASTAYVAGTVSLGDFALFQAYLINLFGKLDDLGNVIRKTYTAYADAKEMVDILETPYEIQDRRGAKPLNVSDGRVEFQNVSFYYHQTRPVLKNYALTIKPREKIALVGSSGAGKSTVVKLLLRFYDLDRGKILIDGQNIANVTQDSLRDQIALVPQEPLLFHRTLRDNIRYGRRDATDDEVTEAAKKAHCHEFITQLPQGYETYVGERGVKLSGGERQRVAIARAILKNAPILLLDEATSSLDSESEALIQEALHELMKDKTVIAIAHRLSTIMQMDRIIVMEEGRVTDTGTHERLLKKKGVYQKLWNIQAGGFVTEG